MIDFILARYNYWIVIILMMTGLYIVFSRGNLVKTIIGLNVFQTSVFVFYITIGKVVGGTAPILVSTGKKDKDHAAHGAHGAEAAYGQGSHDGEDHGADHGAGHGAGDSHADAEAYVSGEAANPLINEAGGAAQTGAETIKESLHTLPELSTLPVNSLTGESGNRVVNEVGPVPEATAPPTAEIEIASASSTDVAHAAAHGPEEAAHAVAKATSEVLYSNPLPHVLILTAIVVGVATTAVGLAIAVRIREAYGTIEEDALEAMNNEAEFGRRAAEEMAEGTS